MENDLIRRSDAKNAIAPALDTHLQVVRAWIALNDIPAVDAVEVRHGRWLRKEDGVYCTWCTFGWKFMTGVPGNVETDYRYCPNCGARMDGEDGDGDG